jgi:hypothetical protein
MILVSSSELFMKSNKMERKEEKGRDFVLSQWATKYRKTLTLVFCKNWCFSMLKIDIKAAMSMFRNFPGGYYYHEKKLNDLYQKAR